MGTRKMQLKRSRLKSVIAAVATTLRRGFARGAVAPIALLGFAGSPTLGQSGPSQSAPGATVPVAANINITPKRLTLEPGERTATVYVFNQGTVPATFDITLVDRVMMPNGEIEPVTAAERRPEVASLVTALRSAKDLLLATPRRAVLAPGKGQTIRVRLKAPPSGVAEYRTHLTVTTVPPRDTGLTAEEAAAGSSADQLTFEIASVFGISIPVIIRTGKPDVRGRIAEVSLNAVEADSPSSRVPVLAFDLERTGANSLYGNVEVRGSRSKTPLAVARGVGVYTEVGSRRVQIPLQQSPARGERLEIKFIDDDVTPGRTIAETSYVVR